MHFFGENMCYNGSVKKYKATEREKVAEKISVTIDI
nr:MAG TPA: hypothetical protein [Caudoviricetes sp.]